MLVGNIYPLPYLSLILYWCWNITDISHSSFFTVQSPPHFCTGNTNLSLADLTESLLDISLDHCSDWTVICFFWGIEMHAHSQTTEHNHIDCMNKMPNHLSWKVNIWSLPPLFSLKSCVLLKSYTLYLAFLSQKEKMMVEFCWLFLWIPEVKGSICNLESAKTTIQQTHPQIHFKNGLGRSLNNQHSWTVFITHSPRIFRPF